MTGAVEEGETMRAGLKNRENERGEEMRKK